MGEIALGVIVEPGALPPLCAYACTANSSRQPVSPMLWCRRTGPEAACLKYNNSKKLLFTSN